MISRSSDAELRSWRLDAELCLGFIMSRRLDAEMSPNYMISRRSKVELCSLKELG